MLWLGWHKKELWKPYFHCGPLRTGYMVYKRARKGKILKMSVTNKNEQKVIYTY